MTNTCIQCNITITCTNFVTCLCNSAIHFKCLNAHNSLPYNWITSSAVHKHVVSVLKSPSFKFSCQTCLQKPNLIPSSTIPPLSTSMTDLLNTIPFLIKDISSRLDKQDTCLLNIYSQLQNIKSNYKYSTITHPTVTSSIPFLPPPPPSTSSIPLPPPPPPPTPIPSLLELPINMHFRPVSNPYISRPNCQITHINHTRPLPPSIPPNYNSIVIEHLNSKQTTKLFLTDLLLYIHLPSNAISTYKFINNIVIIYFNSDNSYYTFTSKIQNIMKHPHYTNLYFRKQRSLLERVRGKLLYHATKANLTPPNTKCTYNNSNETYELRNIINSKVDWKSSPINITPHTYKTWEHSYESYIKAKSYEPHNTSSSIPPA